MEPKGVARPDANQQSKRMKPKPESPIGWGMHRARGAKSAVPR